METAMGYLTEDEGRAWFSSDEKKWKNRITKLAEEYPEQVKITVYPEGKTMIRLDYDPVKELGVSLELIHSKL